MARPLKPSAHRAGRRSEWIETAPRESLSGVIDAGWIGRAGWPRRLRLLPDGCADLVWDGRRLSFAAPRDTAVRSPLPGKACNVGLRLRCGAAGIVAGFGAPLPTALADGQDRLRGARDPERQLEILQDLVERRLAEVSLDRPVLTAVAQIGAGARIDAAAAAAGLEPRALRRRFDRAVGLSPKRLQRVLRFGRLADALGRAPAAQLALELGYADQAHMIRECRAVAGSTPTELATALAA